MIECKALKPTLHEYKTLFESTGWTSSITISHDILKMAIDSSWYWVSASDNEPRGCEVKNGDLSFPTFPEAEG
jgi:hypothetical protein